VASGDGYEYIEHEQLCRASFQANPVRGYGAGSRAQRALLNGGTLANQGVTVTYVRSHGVVTRELITNVDRSPGDTVTLYGGVLVSRPPVETNEHTHIRSIPSTNLALNGKPFALAFPAHPSTMNKLSHRASLVPVFCSEKHRKVISTSGLGFMANGPTVCPSGSDMANVTIQMYPLARVVPGVRYDSIMVLEVGRHRLPAGTRIICKYESVQGSTDKFTYQCRDPVHYEAAGQDYCPISSDDDEDAVPED
jgi:hypothetical protein